MKENYFEEIKMRYIKDAMQTNDCAKEKDVNRNHVNYGCCISWAYVLQDMGHKTETPVYEDNGVLKIPFLKIDGQKIIEFETQNKKQ